MKNYIILSLLILSQSTSAYVLKQGEVEVTLKDLDGFAKTIPSKDRAGFFSSPKRIEDTLYTLLNMKQIEKYGTINLIINDKQVKYIANEKFSENNTINNFNVVNMNNDDLLINYYQLQESYKQVQQFVFASIEDTNFDELAKEKYLINKRNFFTVESRDIQIISVPYNKNTRSDKISKVKNILNKIKNNINYFDEKYNKNLDSNAEIETAEINSFKFEHKDDLLTKVVFSNSNTGVIKKILDYNHRLMIINIKKITPETIIPFDDVKDSILKSIKKEISEKKFTALINTLTKEKIQVNDELMLNVINRYTK